MTKKLQIVRVDNDLVQRANLLIGNNIIGRGAATGCNDGQVLKHAVTINLSPNDEMTITPVAPCYMKPAGCARWRSLKLGDSVPIKPGDVCSLLPDKCWFKIISTDMMQEGDQMLKRKVDEENLNNVDNKKACLLSSMEAAVSPGKTLNDVLQDKDLSNERKDCPVNGNGEHRDEAAPVLQIDPASVPEGNDMTATSSKMSTDSQDVIEPPVDQESNRKRKVRNINLTNKAATNGESGKKVKWDVHVNDQIEEVPSNNPQSPVAMSQDQASTSNSNRVSREKCRYGAQCYRKNPNHKNNYSHPDDSDYDEVDNREECPYGAKCYRKNPQHKAQFKHTAPRRRRRAATPMHSVVVDTSETEASSAEESVDESDYEPSVYTESSDDWDDRSELEDGTTG
ncbi:PREDICTED: ATP-dependent DNA helicase ku70 isoform X1 [Trachymyrmex cornetzi]|uniref:Aprataxin and PNK-like factor n=2 Tax=Trachymyrmex cornetzi TaxID=471704 RepID=A0A195EGK4_9HYME|nr:PREDICTED: ATP-dependent DNA helicase ku70 isoform X1 [Trachymyrmex cornetzi]KYN27019.1 Aprataxin and PNK-like factor [Trachymyrmex cornetzi]